MAEEIVHISNIQPKQQNTAASGISNAEFQDFVKTYEKNHQVMMNLVASTSSNATSIYRNILESVKGVQSKQVSYGNSIMDALSTNNALAQTISTAVTTGLSKISSSLDVIGDLVLEVATPKVDPNEELAKQIWNKMLIDNRTFISKWKFDELDDMMHPSKAKKPSFAPIAIPGSSISGSLSSTLDEMYLMFDMYSSEVLQNQGLTIKTLRDIYTLGDLWSDSSVDVATSMSKYVTDTYTLLDLWSDEQMVFNKKVLELLGSYDDKLKLIQEAKEAAKNQSTNVTQQNQQKFGIANKQTNIGVDQSIKMQYTGNIDVRSIKELLESNAIFNPAKIQLIKYAFKSVATSIAAGLNEIRQVLSPKGLGQNAAGENIFDDPVKTIEGASTLIKTITDLASLGGNTIKRNSSKSVFGVELFNIQKETKLIGKGNTKKLSAFIKSVGSSIAEAFSSIKEAQPTPDVIASVKNITDMLSAITNILNPRSSSKSITLFGKTLFEKETPRDVSKDLKSFKKRFNQILNSIVDVYKKLKDIDIDKDKINGISVTISSVTQAISGNTIKPSDALGFNLVVSSVSKFFSVIAEAKVDTEKAKDINAAISSVMKSLSEHKITVRQAMQLGAISTGISSFFNILSKVKVDLTQSENVALVLNEVLEVLEKRKVSAKQGASMSVLSGGIWLLGKALASIGKLERQITSGKNALVSFFTDISEKVGSKRTHNTMKSIGVFATGLATLGVAIVAFAAISPIAVVAAGVLALFGKTVRLTVASRKTVSGIAMFTASLAMLGVSLWAFSEVSVEYLPGVVLGLATLAGAIWLFGAGGKFGGMSLTGKPPYKMLGIMAAGLATLGLAMWAWEELGLTGETTLKIAGALATLAGAGWAFSKVSQQAPKNMAIMAAGVAALAGAVWAWQKVNPTWELLGIIGTGIAGIAITSLLMSKVPITSGATMIMMSVGVAALGGAAWIWAKSGVTWEIMGMMGVGIAGLAIASYALGNPLALLGATTMVVLGAGLLAISGALAIIAKSGITTDSATAFIKSVGIITLGMAALAIPAVPAVATSVMLVPVAATSLAMAGIFAILSNIKIREDRIRTFGNSINILVEKYDEIGIVKAGKAAAKAVLLLPVATSAFATAIVVRMVAGLNINQDRISQNADAMGIFLEKMVEVFGNVGDRVKAARKGIKAVADLGSTIKSLADAVLTVSKMEYTRNEIRDGKIVPVEICKLTDADFERVGESIGKILTSLIDPLVTIGSQQPTYKLGRFTIQNPFGGSNKVKKGIEAIKGIGEIFNPLANIVKAITESGALGKDSQNATEKIKNIIGGLLSSLSTSIISLEKVEMEDTKGIKKFIEGITPIFQPIGELMNSIAQTGILDDKNTQGFTKLQTTIDYVINALQSMAIKLTGGNAIQTATIQAACDSLSKIFETATKADTTGITKFREEIDKLYDKLSQVKVWNTFRVNFRDYVSSTGKLVKHINGIELEKAIVLRDVVKDLKEADENGNIERLIEKMQELIGRIDENQTQQTQMLQQQTDNISTITNNVTNVNKQQQLPVPQEKEPQLDLTGLNATLNRILQKLNSRIMVAQAPGTTFQVQGI